MQLKRVVILAALVVTAPSSTVHADIESPLVQKGLAAAAAADYPRAVGLLEQAQKESLTREEKLATYHALGLAHAALGEAAAAREAFAHLLRLDPGHQLDRSVAPKVRALFEEARARAATTGGLQPALPPVQPALDPARPREGHPITLRVQYPGGVAQKMVVYYRRSGQASWARLTTEGHNGGFAATLPAFSLHAPALEYQVELLDDAGAAIASAGSLAQPLSVAVQASPMPIYKKGWFWGVIGSVAAAGALATALALTLPRSTNAPVTVIPQ